MKTRVEASRGEEGNRRDISHLVGPGRKSCRTRCTKLCSRYGCIPIDMGLFLEWQYSIKKDILRVQGWNDVFPTRVAVDLRI